MKQKNKINRKALVIVLLGLLILGIFIGHRIYDNHQYSANPYTKKAIVYNKNNHTVTKYLKNYTSKNGLNVVYADASQKFDFETWKSKLILGNYNKIIILSYSDACPRCNSEKLFIANYIKRMATSKQLIIAVNEGRQMKELKSNFELPDYYHYPSVFIYTQNTNYNIKPDEKLIMDSSAFLGKD